MSKVDLTKKLAELIQTRVDKQVDEQLGCEQSSSDLVRGLSFLRMMHDTLVMAGEKIGDPILSSKFGVSIKGYSRALQSEPMSTELNNCLREICAETDVLQYVESPYTRLFLLHIGCISSVLQKKLPTINVKTI